MTILVLDPRWPDLIPMHVAARICEPLAFTSEVPISVRWNAADLLHDEQGWGWLLTTNPADAEVTARVERGEALISVASLEDPVHQATETMRVARLRGEWEMGMTHTSLLPYLEEEAGEFADAVRAGAPAQELKKELSDVLLQVLFHAEIAPEFDFAAVAQAFVDKMRSRAPYLFDASDNIVPIDEQERLWAEGKTSEAQEATETPKAPEAPQA